MKIKKNKISLLIISCTAVILLVIGCSKTKPDESAQKTSAVNTTQKAEASETIEQTTCPVMGGPINKDIFVEYKGKKVYFCCPGCEEKFNKDPEKYLSKLPQFKEE